MQTFGDSLRAEGEAIGMAKGMRQGKAGALTLLLETRFGTLPEEVRDRIGTADVPQLYRWAGKAANAPTLDAMFNGRHGLTNSDSSGESYCFVSRGNLVEGRSAISSIDGSKTTTATVVTGERAAEIVRGSR